MTAQDFVTALWQEHEKKTIIMVSVDTKTFSMLLSHPTLADLADSSGSIVWRYITIYEDKSLPNNTMRKLYKN